MIAMVTVLGVLFAIVALSYLIEELRAAPLSPLRLTWDPTLRAQYLDVAGTRLRYVETGGGPTLVLLHTLRTQLDMFQKLIPLLAKRFKVYALDLPGHGYSDIPNVAYTAEFFAATVGKVLDRLPTRDAIVIGESIGGTIGLLLAARGHPKVRVVVAINPYDYAGGRGLRRSSWLANLVLGLNNVPLVGDTVSRLRMLPILKRIFEGGVVRPRALPAELADEMYLVGNRPGHRKAFSSLVRHWGSWEAAHAEYGHIERPTLLIYGDHDWSHPDERAATAAAIPGSTLRVIENAGHFLSLDAPRELMDEMLAWLPLRQREISPGVALHDR